MPMDPLPPPPPPIIDSVDIHPDITTDDLTAFNGFPPIDIDDVVMTPSSSSSRSTTTTTGDGGGGRGSTNFIRNFGEGPSSSSASKFIDDLSFIPETNNTEFVIHYKSNMYKITISEYATLSELKSRIEEVTMIPNSRQILNGWKINRVWKLILNLSFI